MRLQEAVAEQVAKSASQHLTAIETADREDAVGDWLEDHDIDGGWDIAPTFVEGGIDTDWLERISATADELDASTSVEEAIRWISYTIESELLMNQISEASKRISALVADAKQYSRMDRAPFDVADVHELLRSTLVMFADRLSKDGGKDAEARSQWSRNSTNRFPKSLAFQAISTRCGPTSSTTRWPRCARRAAR